MEAGKHVKAEGRDNDLLDLIAADPAFGLAAADLEKCMDPKRYVGRSPEQVTEFLKGYVEPVLSEYRDELGDKAEINI